MSIIDQPQRQQALDPRESFIVQAPAGSGKTELLIQRFLTLLTTVREPEEILAITFTRKAASEMRERIIKALENAANHPMPQSAHEQKTWTLANCALKQNEKYQWELLQNPSRLRIQTIDSLCANLTSQLPISSGFGTKPEISDNAFLLYQQAVRELFNQLDTNPAISAPITDFLLHLDNNYARAENLLTQMLSSRDHWLAYVLQKNVRQDLEAGLLETRHEILEDLENHLSDSLKNDIIQAVKFATLHVSDNHPLRQKTLWEGAASMLLTSDNQWRRKVDVRSGFPAATSGKTPDEKVRFKEMKAHVNTLLEALQTRHDLRVLFTLAKILPPEQYTDEQWRFLDALFKILPVLAAQLNVIFSQTGCVDFTEVSLAALLALGECENPSQLALTLDYRIQHILVDEFQDTSIMQLTLLEKLTLGWEQEDGRTLFIVGDPMQSIYRFRNAEVGLFLRARTEGIGHIPLNALTLKTNFRSNKNIIDWVNTSFEKIFPEKEDIGLGAVPFSPCYQPGNIQPGHIDNSIHTHLNFANNDDEGEFIAKEIRAYQQNGPDKTIAILVKSRHHLTQILPALQLHQIDYQAVEIDHLATLLHIQDLFSLTRALLHFADRIAWFSILRSPWSGLTLNDLHLIASTQESETIWERINNLSDSGGLDANTQARLSRFISSIKKALKTRHRKPLDVWLRDTWIDLGGIQTLKSPSEIDDCDTYFSLLHKLNSGEDLLDLSELENELGTLYANTAASTDNPVQVMTIHKSKGLEFDKVILPNLNRTTRTQDPQLMLWTERPRLHAGYDLLLAPIKSSRDSNDPIYHFLSLWEKDRFDYENRRLFYVAATRAKHDLLLTACADERAKQGSFLSYLYDAQPGLACAGSRADEDRMDPAVKPQDDVVGEELMGLSDVALDDALSRTLKRFSCEQLNALPAIKRSTPGHNTLKTSDIHWHLAAEKHVGILIHRILQQIAEDGLDQWPIERIDSETPFWQAYLRQHIINNSDTVNTVKKAITNTLTDKIGRWILSNHSMSHCEFELSTLSNNQLKRYVIDRCFIDETDELWIVDYKTGEHNVEKFEEQIDTYKRLLHDIYHKTPKAGLYFPLTMEWHILP